MTAPLQPPCKHWHLSYRTPTGYGRKQIKGRSLEAHRYVWEQAHGPIPQGMHVMHICDVRDCVELTHLRLGTHQENILDRTSKGRGVRGEGSPKAKLNDEIVRSIRQRVNDGESRAAIARDLGVHPSIVSRAAARITWSHVS